MQSPGSTVYYVSHLSYTGTTLCFTLFFTDQSIPLVGQMDILVHVSAPSSISDDARYRAQVAAIRAMMQLTDEPESQADLQVASAAVPCLSANQSALETQISAKAPTEMDLSLDHSLDSIISVIPDSQPTQPLQNRDPEPLDPFLQPPSKRRRPEGQGTSVTPTPAPALPRLSSSPSPAAIPPPISTDSRSEYTLFSQLPVEIRPPPPPISTSPFTTHITPTLDMLVDRLNPARSYKPRRQVRPLETLERGYWAVQITIRPDPPAGTVGAKGEPYWNGELFARFWGFLNVFIGQEGRAGWGGLVLSGRS
ncbi:acetamidase [Penicillium maclennaniae]|uniref:acetamidase n=1 Tax=Penicillium maclennaniae TaxID=1343394 RepID=UPI0025407594|nr:acetamidase [Penicillium maclennaniae]KAJ5675200.1 acetamidase [Penicillium maclennaniae]